MVDFVMKVMLTSSIKTYFYYTRKVILNFLFFPSSAMAASSSQPETMKAECSLDNPKVHSFFWILIPITPCTVSFQGLWRELYDYLVVFPKASIWSCQMLCKNCFHQENRKLHAMAWSCPLGAWLWWKSGMGWTLHLENLFVW